MPQTKSTSATGGNGQKSPSSKAAASLTRGAYSQYVSTAKWRERRWRLFSTFPGGMKKQFQVGRDSRKGRKKKSMNEGSDYEERVSYNPHNRQHNTTHDHRWRWHNIVRGNPIRSSRSSASRIATPLLEQWSKGLGVRPSTLQAPTVDQRPHPSHHPAESRHPNGYLDPDETKVYARILQYFLARFLYT